MTKKITPIIVTVDELPPPPPKGFGGSTETIVVERPVKAAPATWSECDCEMCRRNADGAWHTRDDGGYGGGC